MPEDQLKSLKSLARRAEDCCIMTDVSSQRWFSDDELATVRHELRTPLSGLIGLASLLLHTPLNADQRAMVQSMVVTGEHLTGLIDDVLVPANEPGMITVTDFDLPSLVHTVVTLFAGQAKAKQLHLATVVERTVPRIVIGDKMRVRQILVNLLSNAVRYTTAGGVTVRVCRDGTEIRFDVEDSGPGFVGIAEQDHRRAADGSGLGLIITRQLISRLGGHLGVASIPGSGSTFTVLLPLADSDGPAVPSPSPALPAEILIADDDSVTRQVVAALVSNLGYRTRTVSTGQEALEIWRTGLVDLILLDCRLPDLDGIDVTAHVRNHERTAGRHTPVVAMTAGASIDHRLRCLKAGMDDYLSKPIDVDHLTQILADWTGPTSPVRGALAART